MNLSSTPLPAGSECCPFCDPAIEQSTWLETPTERVICNIAPIVPGHSLVITKRHAVTLLNLDDAELTRLFQTARTAMAILVREFGSEGFDLSLQEGEVAGQTIPHLHIHLIPRKRGDLAEGQDWYTQVLDSRARAHLTAQELQVAVARLRQAARDSDKAAR